MYTSKPPGELRRFLKLADALPDGSRASDVKTGCHLHQNPIDGAPRTTSGGPGRRPPIPRERAARRPPRTDERACCPPQDHDAPPPRHGPGRDGSLVLSDARRPRPEPRADGAAHHVHSAARESNRRGASRIMASTPSTRRRLDSPVGSRPGSPSAPTRASRTSACGGKIPSSASGPSNSRRPVWKSRHRAGVATK